MGALSQRNHTVLTWEWVGRVEFPVVRMRGPRQWVAGGTEVSSLWKAQVSGAHPPAEASGAQRASIQGPGRPFACPRPNSPSS